jgi:hypothetical protein
VARPETRGDWKALTDTSVAGLYDAHESVQLTIDQKMVSTRGSRPSTGAGLRSAVHAVPADEIKLVTPSPSNDQGVTASCAEGQVGHYRWSRSADGMSLTLTATDDQCADRISTLSRTWRLGRTS